MSELYSLHVDGQSISPRLLCMTNATTELLRVLGEPLCWPLLSGLWASSPSTLPSPSQAHSSDHIMVHSESPGLFLAHSSAHMFKGKGAILLPSITKTQTLFHLFVLENLLSIREHNHFVLYCEALTSATYICQRRVFHNLHESSWTFRGGLSSSGMSVPCSKAMLSSLEATSHTWLLSVER